LPCKNADWTKVEIPMDIQQAVFEKTVDFGTKILFPLLYIVWLLLKQETIALFP
jgi:hypothetical protein